MRLQGRRQELAMSPNSYKNLMTTSLISNFNTCLDKNFAWDI